MDHDEKELLERYHLSGVYFTDPYPNYQNFRTAYLFDLPLSGMNESKLLNAISKSGIDQNFNVRNKLKEKNISNSNLSSIFYNILIPNSPACRKDLDRLILQHLDIPANIQVLNKDVEEIEEKLEDAYNEGTTCPHCGAHVDFDDDMCLSCYETIHVKCRFQLSKDENGDFIVSEKTPCQNRGPQTKEKNIPGHQKRRGVYIFLAVITGLFGGHNFYARRFLDAILQLLLTCTLIGIIATIIWVVYDIFNTKTDGSNIPFRNCGPCKNSHKIGCFQIGAVLFLILVMASLVFNLLNKKEDTEQNPATTEQQRE